MKVFLSWSGKESKALAALLREWLKTPLHFVKPWMSSEDISAGQPWGPNMADQLKDSFYCIVCVTPGVQSSRWVNFEAGAIWKSFGNTRVSPLLLGVSQEDLNGGPLSMFQCVSVEKEGIQNLIQSINDAAESESRVPQTKLAARLVHSWPWLSAKIESIHTRIVAYRSILKAIATKGNQGMIRGEVVLHVKNTADPADSIGASRVTEYLTELQKDGLVAVAEPRKGEKHRRYRLSKEGRAYLS